LEDRQYIDVLSVLFNVLSVLYNVLSVLYNALSVLQCIVSPPMYFLSCKKRTDNTLEKRQYIEEDRQYIGGQTIH
jgi:hypothetical protein